MAVHVSGGYFPLYPQHDNLPDPDIRTFITNFYRASDKPDANELWISYFTKDAHVIMGRDIGHGEQGESSLLEDSRRTKTPRISQLTRHAWLHPQRSELYAAECGTVSKIANTR